MAFRQVSQEKAVVISNSVANGQPSAGIGECSSSFDENESDSILFSNEIVEDLVNKDNKTEATIHGLIIQDDLLIEAVRTKPAIWDFKNEEFKNRTNKIALWNGIVDDLNLKNDNNGKDITTRIRKRWDYLRKSYYKSKQDAPGGSGGASVKKEFEYTALMSFLDDKDEARSTNSICIFEEDSSSSCLTSPTTTPVPKRRNISLNQQKHLKEQEKLDHIKKKEEFQNRFLKVLEARQTKPQVQAQPTAAEAFLNLLGVEMQQLSERRQRSLRMRILNMVAEEIEESQN